MQERLREFAARDVYFPERDRFVALHRGASSWPRPRPPAE